MNKNSVKIVLRITISYGFLSAVADRFGMWSKAVSAWANWDNIVQYTEVINRWYPSSLISALEIIATSAEILFAVFLLIRFKTELFAKLSVLLLLVFTLSMTFSIGIKRAFDYSVFYRIGRSFCI